MRFRILSTTFFLFAAVFYAEVLSAEPPPPRGRWRAEALTPRVLMLSGDYSDHLQQRYRARMEERKTSFFRLSSGWAKEYVFNITGTEAILEFRPKLVEKLSSGKHKVLDEKGMELKISGFGYWLNPAGLARFENEKGRAVTSRNADVVHYLFLILSEPMRNGKKINIVTASGEEIPFEYSETEPSRLFKINQLGYMPHAGRKFAYLGAWLGTAGPLELESPGHFELIDADSGGFVFHGPVVPRPGDSLTKDGAPFTGENVFEMDFSEVTKPGRCYLRVPGIGRSRVFVIGSQSMAESFYIHARGLYHKRCGIAKEEPFTKWHAPSCHTRIVRGNFPPHAEHYHSGPGAFGFFDKNGNKLTVNHFRLIEIGIEPFAEILRLNGGWHDAADCDRRPHHMTIVSDLAAVYLLKPENFIDGQLNIPESGNGIPDILDEACWGIEHLRQGQSPDGGVGTWIETTRHPAEKDGLPSEEKLTYYLSRSTRQSSLEYSACAAELALALRRAGADEKSNLYARSAEKAWNFAMDPSNGKTSIHRYGEARSPELIFYQEPRVLPPEFIVKAGGALYLLSGKEEYLRRASEAVPEALESMRRTGWKWPPLFWIILEIHSGKLGHLRELCSARRRVILEQADRMIRQQEESYPYRIPWFGPGSGWEHTMAWGTCHPLRRAMTLIAAHACTGDRKYQDAALLANDYHNGANPNGTTMTSGLGRVYPVRFLDLTSCADGIPEFVPGITPFRNTFGIAPADVQMVHGLFYPPRRGQGFPGCAVSLLPGPGLEERECADWLNRTWPVWRRWANLEQYSVPDSEYTVWETIGPAAAASGYLLERGELPRPEWTGRKPASDIRLLPGYFPLP